MFIRTPFKIYIGNTLFSIGVTAILESDKCQVAKYVREPWTAMLKTNNIVLRFSRLLCIDANRFIIQRSIRYIIIV